MLIKPATLTLRDRQEGAQFLHRLNQIYPDTRIDTKQAAAEALHVALKRVAPTPSVDQQEAGNHAMGHVNLHGLPITIERAKGMLRHGRDKHGKVWARKLHAHYGYFRRAVGGDGENPDVWIGEYRRVNSFMPAAAIGSGPTAPAAVAIAAVPAVVAGAALRVDRHLCPGSVEGASVKDRVDAKRDPFLAGAELLGGVLDLAVR